MYDEGRDPVVPGDRGTRRHERPAVVDDRQVIGTTRACSPASAHSSTMRSARTGSSSEVTPGATGQLARSGVPVLDQVDIGAHRRIRDPERRQRMHACRSTSAAPAAGSLRRRLRVDLRHRRTAGRRRNRRRRTSVPVRLSPHRLRRRRSLLRPPPRPSRRRNLRIPHVRAAPLPTRIRPAGSTGRRRPLGRRCPFTPSPTTRSRRPGPARRRRRRPPGRGR